MQTYEKEIRITEPECDINQKLRLSSLMRHTQQIGSDHLHALGLDYNRMMEDGMVFLVNKLMIQIERRPCFDEVVKLRTYPKKAKGAQFIRDTVVETLTGEKLAEVSISWMLVNPQTHKILRPTAFEIYGVEMLPNDGEYITGFRLKAPEGAGVHHLRQVKYSDLDYNRHINNAVYADIVCDMVPFDDMLGRDIASFGIIFQKEAGMGQVLELLTIPLEGDDGYYVGGQVSGGRCFEAQLRFRQRCG